MFIMYNIMLKKMENKNKNTKGKAIDVFHID